MEDNSTYNANQSFQGKGVAMHNLVWWWFQFLMLVPSNILIVYKWWERHDFTDCVYEDELMIESELEEYQKKRDKGKKIHLLKRPKYDDLWLLYSYVAIWYYIHDCFYLITYYNFFEEPCVTGMVLHHIGALPAVFSIVYTSYIPYWIGSIYSLHCVLIVWPYNKILHVPYVMALIFMLYNVLFTKPFTQAKPFRRIVKIVPLLSVGLLFISLNGCDTNDLIY
ncbi:UNKNOWN [Stylonychia lemnae]|uniref:Uncharacterized protein n=1 Tax=Stylonychia lemnae TaxID=5949 RepID=A0A078A3W0_STYLE|nr:UNKNOWN [Stylonychia lemnae]|eukprot:CDW75444.1 UNKNOWN [Stylonychia lemnae]